MATTYEAKGGKWIKTTTSGKGKSWSTVAVGWKENKDPNTKDPNTDPNTKTFVFTLSDKDKGSREIINLWQKGITDPHKICHFVLGSKGVTLCGLKKRKLPNPGQHAPVCYHCLAYAGQIERALAKISKMSSGRPVEVDPRCQMGLIRVVWEKSR